MKASYSELKRSPLARKAALLLALTALHLAAGLPRLEALIAQSINYQGFLLSKITSLPVETPQDITFMIYNAPTGGAVLFTESRCNVPVTKGRYDVEIGSSTAGGIPGDIFLNSQNIWLEVQVDPDGDCLGTYEAMTPRIHLQASPYAFSSLYASTASAATTVFSADIIGALPQTSNGAITISTNLFVQGGISVGDISPGQQLSVAGMVVSKGVWPACQGTGTCGFKFPDDTIQYTAAANTLWEGGAADSLHNINAGSIGLGEFSNPPRARVHISSAAGDTGNLLIISTGTSDLVRVNGLGEVYANSYYGEGSSLTGVVAETGDMMTGPLTLSGSSLTVTSVRGIAAPKLKLADNVEISSASSSVFGGVLISTHVWLIPGAVIHGNGSGLSGVVTLDFTKVSTSGATMSGPLTMGFNPATVSGSSLTVTGDTWLKGNTVLGAYADLGRLTVGGNIVATSSIAAQGLYTTTLNSTMLADLANIRVTTATFWGYSTDDPNTDNRFSIMSSSGIKVNFGKVVAPAFVGNGSLLTNLSGTDSTKLLKAGDTMSGHLLISPSSVTIRSMGADPYALTVSSTASAAKYGFAVSTMGRVGIQVSAPTAPLTVYKQIALINDNETIPVYLSIKSDAPGYIYWSDAFGNLGAMGYKQHVTTRDFVFKALGSDTESGAEVYRIRTDNGDLSGATWKFGVGIIPTERFHVGANMLVSNGASPILSVSTTTEQVGVGTSDPVHKLEVNGGIMATSSVTAQGGFFGNGAGITGISAGGLPGQIVVSSIAAREDSTYAGVVLTSDTYATGKFIAGEIFTALTPIHLRGAVTIDQREIDPSVALNLFAHNGGPTSISFAEGAMASKATLSMPSNFRDLVLNMNTTGDEVFRIKGNSNPAGGAGWRFGIGTPTPQAAFHVAADIFIGTSTLRPVVSLSTRTAYLGISTGTAMEGLHVASSLLVGNDRGSSIFYVSTGTAFTGIGTGSPRAMLEIGNGNILAEGTYSGTPTAPPVTGTGSRFLWMPINSSFRAGGVTGPDALDTFYAWDTIGQYSVALGQDNRAYANWASALGGLSNWANGNYTMVGGGQGNISFGNYSVIPGGRDNVVYSSYSFAGGRNNWLDQSAEGTFVWGYDSVGGQGRFNTDKVTQNFAFLIDPVDEKHYKVGVRTGSPQAAMDVNGDAQFGAGVTKSTFTAEGYFVPRAMTSAELYATTPSVMGAVVFNSDLANICFSTGTAQAGQWAIAGSKNNCHAY
ncbi:MAG: hypothetical protein A2049_02800 [Elusimicrobia bacterium GWA2_62_23]|nr:MAG: hypothetical protein A2049_02800 [Elusimicrobia bacterium GWA2_62_23]OGR70025.1 MAG: hypothetical protein A2179_00205 [Elusimicrobia bacterium GWC2_63_65]